MATIEELKELKNKICDVLARSKVATKEDWFDLWEEAERCRKSTDDKTWANFYWKSGLETVGMIVAGYEYEEQKEKEIKS